MNYISNKKRKLVSVGVSVGCLVAAALIAYFALTPAIQQFTQPSSNAPDVQDFTAPALAFIAIWLGAGPILNVLQRLHSMRDEVVIVPRRNELSIMIDIEHRKAALSNSYFPLLCGFLVFCFVVATFAIAFAFGTPGFYRWLASAVAIQYSFSFHGFLYGGWGDIVVMRRAIDELENTQIKEVLDRC